MTGHKKKGFCIQFALMMAAANVCSQMIVQMEPDFLNSILL